MIREALRQNGAIIAMGILVGGMAIRESYMPAVMAIGAVGLVLSLYRPTVPITMAFVGILLDARGLTSIKVLGVPVTLSKAAVLFAISSHFVNSMVRRVPPITWTPISSGVVAIVITMILSLVTSGESVVQFEEKRASA